VKELAKIIAVLLHSQVEFILIGGLAAAAHGTARVTYDVDVVYNRSPENLRKLVAALAPYTPYLRGAPANLPFLWDEKTLERGLNFTLTTRVGDLDLLGEVTGGGRFEQLRPEAVILELFGFQCLCLDLPQLIQTKRAAGRPKDFEAIAELEILLEEREVLEREALERQAQERENN